MHTQFWTSSTAPDICKIQKYSDLLSYILFKNLRITEIYFPFPLQTFWIKLILKFKLFWKIVPRYFWKLQKMMLENEFMYEVLVRVCLRVFSILWLKKVTTAEKKIHPFASLWYEIGILWTNMKHVKSHGTALGYWLQSDMNQIFQIRYCTFL